MESNFENSTFNSISQLPDFPFKSNFITILGYNIHYIDEGLRDGKPVILLHGVPTWSYLFRNIIPKLVNAGHRVIAPDLLGFGRSSKPDDREIYSFDNLSKILSIFIEKLNMKNIVLFGHDWGAIFGLRLAIENEERFSGLAISNGIIPRGGEKIHPLFNIWKLVTKYSPVIPVGYIVNFGCRRRLTKNERYAYDLPGSNSGNKSAIRILPQLLPFNGYPNEQTAVKIWEKLEKWEKPIITLFSINDCITRDYDRIIQSHIPGARNQNHKRIAGGHFLPEDSPSELYEAINNFITTI